MVGFFNIIIVFLYNIIIFLSLTIIIATVTLIERKIMSLVQRRVGPNYIGYKGRLQFIADALKLLLKHIYIINRVNKVLFLVFPALVLIMCYLFWLNIIWGPSLAICEIEYNLLFMGVLSILFSFLIFLVSWSSKNKYAILSGGRIVVMTLSLEIFLNFLIIYILIFLKRFLFYKL